VTRRLLPALLAALALAGCGVGPGAPERGAAELRVTRDFGHEQLGPVAVKEEIRPSDTVMRFLQSAREVKTRYGGGFVQSIDGLAGSKEAEHDWFFFVNGRESSVGAADVKLSASDVVQWDYRRWTATMHVPAIVGAFPQPFLNGYEGRRLPTRLECIDADSKACATAEQALERAGIVANPGPLGASTGENSIRVVVGTWDEVSATITARLLQDGPAASGVYARFTEDGRLTSLDAAGETARELPPGSGLVAAGKQDEEALTWLVTGDDERGVERAAQAIDPETLRNAYAVAATPSGVVRLPEGGF
jgi:hypothetical protein